MSKKPKPKSKHKSEPPVKAQPPKYPPAKQDPAPPPPPPQEQPAPQEQPPLLSITCPHCQSVVQADNQKTLDDLVNCPTCGKAMKDA
jgi:hypothetical protein